MIARIWHGKTDIKNLEKYTEFTKRAAIPDYSQTEGFKGLTFLRQQKGDEAHFTLITYWRNEEAIKAFTGEEIEKAKYYPEDESFLLEFEETVEHHEVFAKV